MKKVIYEGGVRVSTGDEIAVVEQVRFECQKCSEFKPTKPPKILFTGLVEGTIAVKCPQCHQINRFEGTMM